MREPVNVTYYFPFFPAFFYLLHPFATFTRLDYHFFL